MILIQDHLKIFCNSLSSNTFLF